MTTQSAIVTNAGIDAAVAAGTSGPQISISYFRIGALSQAQGATADPTATDVAQFVYQGDSTQMSYSVIDPDTVLYRIVLETDVGPFQIGNIGLMMPGGTMFAYAVLPQQTPKWADNLPLVVGNRKVIDIVLVLSNQASIVNLTILVANECSLPVVPTEVQLPLASIAPYNTYQVQNHTELGIPCLAFRFNDAWSFTPERLVAGSGGTIFAVSPSSFSTGADVGYVVWNTPNNTYGRAGLGTTGKFFQVPVGVRSSAGEITVLGYYEPSGGGVVPGSEYFLQNDGSIGTTNTGYPIGFGITTTRMWVDFTTSGAGFVDYFSDYFNKLLVEYRISGIDSNWDTLYTVDPTNAITNFIIFSMRITNKTDIQSSFYASYLDASNNNTLNYLSYGCFLDAHETLDVILRPVVISSGDVLQVRSDVQNLDVAMTGIVILDQTIVNYNTQLNGVNPITLVNPTNRTTIIASILAVNVNPAVPVPVTLEWVNGTETVYMANSHLIPAGASIEFMELEHEVSVGSVLNAIGGSIGDVHLTVSTRLRPASF